MASLGGADRPGWHPPGGWYPKEKKFLWANLQRIVKRGRAGKKGVGWHPGGGDTRVKAKKATVIVTAMSKKRSPGFQEKIEGWHPQLPLRVSPTLVMPLGAIHIGLANDNSSESPTHATDRRTFSGTMLNSPPSMWWKSYSLLNLGWNEEAQLHYCE